MKDPQGKNKDANAAVKHADGLVQGVKIAKTTLQ